MATIPEGTVVVRRTWRDRFADYAALTKARLAAMVLLTTLAGFMLARPGPIDGWLLTMTLIGTGLTSLGANALNQWMEVRLDAMMNRTAGRPLPAGRITLRHALLLSAALLLAGPLLLFNTVNGLTAALGVVSAVIYVAIYTPLKTRTSLCTLAGAVCGAIPPVMGWTAAAGRLDAPAIILAAILLIWQIPHSLAMAWLHREDYARAGFRLLPAIDHTGEATGAMAVLYSLALVPIGLTAVMAGLGGWLYAAACVALGMGLTLQAARFRRDGATASAKRLFLATLAYLPLLFAFMVADGGPARVLDFH